jgi:hypothetical protein
MHSTLCSVPPQPPLRRPTAPMKTDSRYSWDGRARQTSSATTPTRYQVPLFFFFFFVFLSPRLASSRPRLVPPLCACGSAGHGTRGRLLEDCVQVWVTQRHVHRISPANCAPFVSARASTCANWCSGPGAYSAARTQTPPTSGRYYTRIRVHARMHAHTQCTCTCLLAQFALFRSFLRFP